MNTAAAWHINCPRLRFPKGHFSRLGRSAPQTGSHVKSVLVGHPQRGGLQGSMLDAPRHPYLTLTVGYVLLVVLATAVCWVLAPRDLGSTITTAAGGQ